MNKLTLAFCAALLACTAASGVASAQQYGYPPAYGNGQWNGQGSATVRGTITAVNGNQVTLRVARANAARRRDADGDNDDRGNNGYYNNGRNNNGGYYNNGRYNGMGGGNRQITIDDQPALDNRTSGRVEVGRFVTARGYWQNGVFFATSMY